MENYNRFISLIENSGTFIEVWKDIEQYWSNVNIWNFIAINGRIHFFSGTYGLFMKSHCMLYPFQRISNSLVLNSMKLR